MKCNDTELYQIYSKKQIFSSRRSEMKIGILGSGMVGQALARKLAQIGQEVLIGSGHPSKLAEFAAQNPGVRVGSFSESAAHGEIIFNATKGDASLAVLQSAGEENLRGKILVDISNPLDFSHGMPPTLFVGNTDSLGEQIQRAFPETQVVKAFNTLTASLMVEPGALAEGDHTLFICGNDTEAKARLTNLFRKWFGWSDILDVGDITAARATEALLPLWVRLYMKFGTGQIQFKIVR
jgi:predicted dinucleotide-binding enzyme